MGSQHRRSNGSFLKSHSFRRRSSRDDDWPLVFGTGFAAGILLVLLCAMGIQYYSSFDENMVSLQRTKGSLSRTSPAALFLSQQPLSSKTTNAIDKSESSSSNNETGFFAPAALRNMALIEVGCFLIFRGVPRLMAKLLSRSRRIVFLRGRLWQASVKVYSRTGLSKIVNRGKKVIKVLWYRNKKQKQQIVTKDTTTTTTTTTE